MFGKQGVALKKQGLVKSKIEEPALQEIVKVKIESNYEELTVKCGELWVISVNLSKTRSRNSHLNRCVGGKWLAKMYRLAMRSVDEY